MLAGATAFFNVNEFVFVQIRRIKCLYRYGTAETDLTGSWDDLSSHCPLVTFEQNEGTLARVSRSRDLRHVPGLFTPVLQQMRGGSLARCSFSRPPTMCRDYGTEQKKTISDVYAYVDEYVKSSVDLVSL